MLIFKYYNSVFNVVFVRCGYSIVRGATARGGFDPKREVSLREDSGRLLLAEYNILRVGKPYTASAMLCSLSLTVSFSVCLSLCLCIVLCLSLCLSVSLSLSDHGLPSISGLSLGTTPGFRLDINFWTDATRHF